MKEELHLNDPMIQNLILEANKAVDEAFSMSPIFAKWILKPFFGFQIEDALLFYYKHASFNFGANNYKLFVNQNNAFSTRNTDLRTNPNGWICMLIKGEIRITLDDRQLLISASDGYKIFYQSNYGLHETHHFDATIVFLPVGAVNIDVFDANKNLWRNEVKIFSIIDLIKISILPGGVDFILEKIILGKPVGKKINREITYLIDGISNRFKMKAAIAESSFSAASISKLKLSGHRFRKYISILKIIQFEESKYDYSREELAYRLGYSSMAKLREFLEKEEEIYQMLDQEKF